MTPMLSSLAVLFGRRLGRGCMSWCFRAPHKSEGNILVMISTSDGRVHARGSVGNVPSVPFLSSDFTSGAVGRTAIEGSQISGRALEVAVPQGATSAAQQAVLSRITAAAAQRGVQVIVVPTR